jgi:hypothetical protein
MWKGTPPVDHLHELVVVPHLVDEVAVHADREHLDVSSFLSSSYLSATADTSVAQTKVKSPG